MSRRPTPDILGAVLEAPSEAVAILQGLKYDYTTITPLHRQQVQQAAVDIVKHGRRTTESLVAIGQRLIEVKRLLDHGQFSDWYSTEFDMSQRTAQNMMAVARTFGDKNETVSLLSDSALYLLSAPSTPEPARVQVIEEAQSNGTSPTKARVQTIIDAHRPDKKEMTQWECLRCGLTKYGKQPGECRKCGSGSWQVVDDRQPGQPRERTFEATIPTIERTEIEAEWVALKTPPPADIEIPDRRAEMAGLLIDSLIVAVQYAKADYGTLTGRHADVLPLERAAGVMIEHLRQLMDDLTDGDA